MDILELANEIEELIKRGTEGEYWDFKQKWHSSNTDLLHDIICMANSPANRDCYIIIGIGNDANDILGVDPQDRKNQQNVIDLVRQKPRWAGGYAPEVYVRTIFISDKEIDVIIIKQSDNTPFFLLEDYSANGSPIFKGNIYTRKGDTNTPKNAIADLYDTELLWKRRLGLLYSPSQRAKHYLRDLENWERIDGEQDKQGMERFFFYYKLDPDYTVHIVDTHDIEENETDNKPKDINDNTLGAQIFYLFAFCNVSYHTEFSNDKKIILYYRDIPLFGSFLEAIDEGRTKVIPPEFWIDSYYIKESFRYLIFEFVFEYLSGNYAIEARQMFMRVIPVYKTENEHSEFKEYIENRGFPHLDFSKKPMCDEALTRYDNTVIEKYEYYGNTIATEHISKKLNEDTDLVINFAHPENSDYDGITDKLKRGKMLVDWLDEWRIK